MENIRTIIRITVLVVLIVFLNLFVTNLALQVLKKTESQYYTDNNMLENSNPWLRERDLVIKLYKETQDTVRHAIWRSDFGLIEGDCPSYGVFNSKITDATWVICIDEAGKIKPVYVETNVTVYPGPVNIDYKTDRVETNRVIRQRRTITIQSKSPSTLTSLGDFSFSSILYTTSCA